MDTILNYAGSIASIVSLILMLIPKGRKHYIALMAITALLGAISSYSTYKYIEATKPAAIRLSRMNELKIAADTFLNNNMPTSYVYPGKSVGIVRSGLGILETYRDILPETYESIKGNFEADMSYAIQNRDTEKERVAIENAAHSIITFFKSLSSTNQK